MKRTYAVIASLPLLVLMVGCSENTPPAATQKEPEKPAEPVTALYGLQKMYVTARSWAPDAQVLSMSNLDLKEVKSVGGKAGAWECTFVTERRHRARRYTYSEVAASGLPKGVFGGSEDAWYPSNQQRPFFIQAVKTDSVAAYETALKKSAEYVKKHPDMAMKFLLEFSKELRNPAWRVVWGESVAMSDYSVYVDATTGAYVKTAR